MWLVVHSHSCVNDMQLLIDFNDGTCVARLQMNTDTKATAVLRNLVTVVAVTWNYLSVVSVPLWALERGAHGDGGGGNAGGTTMIRIDKEDEAIQWIVKQKLATFNISFVSYRRKHNCSLLVVTIHPSCNNPIVASGIRITNIWPVKSLNDIIQEEK